MNNKFWNAPAWSMANRAPNLNSNKKNANFNPGPGNYNLAGNDHGIGCRIGTSVRNGKGRQNQPGPGNYQLNSKGNGPQITMGKKMNSSLVSGINNTPGPGNYNTCSITKKCDGVTLGAKYSSMLPNKEDPGPGAYTLNSMSKSGVKIGTSTRTNLGNGSKNPGPGAYTYDKRPYSAGPKYRFGRQERSEHHPNNNVGPGSYEIKSSIKQFEGGCTLGTRNNKGDEHFGRNPGPGYYDVAGKSSVSGAKIGKAQRGGFGSMITPGPGAYGNQSVGNAYGTKIGTSKRGEMGASQTPGPGAYQFSKNIKSGITITGNRGKSRLDSNPGPGSYTPNEFGSHVRPGSANIGKSQRSGFTKSGTPGPGQYYKQQSAHYKFAHTNEARSKQLKNGDPGPGQYQIPSTVPSAPHYLIDPSVYKSGGSRI